jgi:hypothetical protein
MSWVDRVFKMGCTGSKIDPREKEASQTNARIERQLRADRRQETRTVKILLLGMYRVHMLVSCFNTM